MTSGKRYELFGKRIKKEDEIKPAVWLCQADYLLLAERQTRSIQNRVLRSEGSNPSKQTNIGMAELTDATGLNPVGSHPVKV